MKKVNQQLSGTPDTPPLLKTLEATSWQFALLPQILPSNFPSISSLSHTLFRKEFQKTPHTFITLSLWGAEISQTLKMKRASCEAVRNLIVIFNLHRYSFPPQTAQYHMRWQGTWSTSLIDHIRYGISFLAAMAYSRKQLTLLSDNNGRRLPLGSYLSFHLFLVDTRNPLCIGPGPTQHLNRPKS